jgi:glucose-1-phosphate cytidylyltransferase
MKGVLFCGGHGMCMRTAEDHLVPNLLQMVGPRPLLWHVMRYYAHYGHKEFILCLGYGADKITGLLSQLTHNAWSRNPGIGRAISK